MATKITMPRLSDTMTEGTVAKWLKKVGDQVKEGDILAEIETDKATMEFESFNSGVLLHIGVPEGGTAPIDSLLAVIGQAGEVYDASAEDAPKVETAPKEESAPVAEVAAPAASNALPKGVIVVTMPRLSDTMTQGTVATWLKAEGDTIKEGDILAEIETDKATMEFESFYSGTLLKIGVKVGESAPVDSMLAIIGPAGTDVSGVNAASAAPATAAPEVTETPAAAPVAAVEEVSHSGGRLFVSPLARKMAEEKGIDLRQVKGSGENGRIIKSDIENFKPQAAATPVAAAAATPAPVYKPVGSESVEEVKNSQMRKIIAKRLSESSFTAPHFFLTIEVDMDAAIAARSVINAIPETKVSYNDMVIKASAMALRKHPKVNSRWTEEATLINKHIHIGVAVAVEDGLVVPVLKFADQMSFSEITHAVKDVAGRAKSKKLTPDEMDGSTFTISNLGMFGIREFTSIINQPNSAILSVGAIVEKPVVKNGQIVVGNTMTLTLACDHRTVDGAIGAQFLQTLRMYLEQPVTMLA